jgi:hypothetical protein
VKGGEARAAAGAFHRCPAAARWLPRVLAASVLMLTLVAALGVDPDGVVARWSSGFRGMLAVAGAVAALWIVRRGGEVRREVRALDDALEVREGRRLARLPYAQIDSLEYVGPFGVGRSWLPALVVVDDTGRIWRFPALLPSGDRLVQDLLERSERSDLRSWAEARGLPSRMAHASRNLAIGYGVTGSLLGLATTLLLRGGS